MPDAKQELIDRLKGRRERFEEEHADWEEVRAKWVAALEDLFALLDKWLKPLEDQKLIRVEREHQTITEENLDPYLTRAYKIIASGRRVHIQPVARYVLGACGRVDMLSGGRRIALLRDEQGNWGIRLGMPGVVVDPLTEQTFYEAFNDLIK